MDAAFEQQYKWGAALNKNRRALSQAAPDNTGDRKQSLRIFDSMLFAAFMLIFFDIPTYMIAFVPFVGWGVAFIWALFGKLCVLLWLGIKGKLHFDTIIKNVLSLTLSSAAFIVLFTLRQRYNIYKTTNVNAHL